MDAEYGTVVTAIGMDVVVIETEPALTVRVSCWVALPCAKDVADKDRPSTAVIANFRNDFI